MAFSPLSRRSFLRHMPVAAAAAGTLASSAALAVPAIAAVAPTEEPWVKARRLGKELAQTLLECEGNLNAAYIVPRGVRGAGVWFMSPDAGAFVSRDAFDAVDLWRQTQVAANECWDRYCKAGKGKHETIYAEWRRLHAVKQEAMSDMLKALYNT